MGEHKLSKIYILTYYCVEVFPATSSEGAATVAACGLRGHWTVVDCTNRIHCWRRHKGPATDCLCFI